MPLQNRVTPSGEIVSTPQRGLFTGIALTISRGQGRLTQALGIVAMAPLSMPHLAIGIALYETFLLQWDLTGLELAGSFAGLVAGHLVIALPYVVRGVAAGHAHFDRFDLCSGAVKRG